MRLLPIFLLLLVLNGAPLTNAKDVDFAVLVRDRDTDGSFSVTAQTINVGDIMFPPVEGDRQPDTGSVDRLE